MPKRGVISKLKTFLTWKDTRVTEGEVYSEIREGDFYPSVPFDEYIKEQETPEAFDIRNFGADVTSPDNAPAVNNAIKAASEKGGTVLVAGGEYTCSQINLLSDVTLFVEKASSLIAKSNGEGYPDGSFIHAEDCRNITITGGGKIKGNGHFFGYRPVYDNNLFAPVRDWVDIIEERQDYRRQLRFAHPTKYGSLCILKNCGNVQVKNIIFENSPGWTLNLCGCNNAEVSDFVINNNRNVANTDGIDVVGSSDVKISHCFISTADDGIVLKNAVWEGVSEKMTGVSIADCRIITRTNGIKIGTETTNDIEDISVTDCRISLPDLWPGAVSALSVESADGSKVRNISISNIVAENCCCPLFIRLCNRNRAAEVNAQSARAIEFAKKAEGSGMAEVSTYNHRGEISNISVTNLFATNASIPIIICGYREKLTKKCVEKVTLKNIHVKNTALPYIVDRRLFIPEYEKEYPDANRFRNLPSYGIFARHVKGLKMTNVTFNQRKTYKKEQWLRDVK